MFYLKIIFVALLCLPVFYISMMLVSKLMEQIIKKK
jgi:hypothetical protein